MLLHICYIFSVNILLNTCLNCNNFCDHDLCDLTVKPLGLLQGIFVTKFFIKITKMFTAKLETVC